VESNNIAELRTKVVAEVAAVHVREGQWVQQGDLLVELRTDELALQSQEKRAELDLQQAQLESLRTEHRLLQDTSAHYRSVWDLSQKKLKRQQDLLEKRMISQALMDDAVREANQATIAYQDHVRTLADFPNRLAQQEASVARAEAQWQQALINLERAEIHAPFNGPVMAVSVAVGDFSSLGEPLVIMADESEFVVRAPVPNRYAQRLREHLEQGRDLRSSAEIAGQPVFLSLDRLGRDVKAGESGLHAFFVMDAGQDIPEIGRILDLTVQLPEESGVVALPAQSIYENDRIYQVRENRLQALSVERVGEYETPAGEYRVLVRSAELASGEQVITTQLPRAISGLLVEPIIEMGAQQLAQHDGGIPSGGSR
jgi:multidrug efflux pump subunit AcrA (membrane-fusion protein)